MLIIIVTCQRIARQRTNTPRYTHATIGRMYIACCYATVSAPMDWQDSYHVICFVLSALRNSRTVFSVRGPCREDMREYGTLRVVGGDEKGSLKSETVKYGRKSQGTRTRERLRWQGPAVYTKDKPVLSSERTSHGIKNVTVRRIPYSEREKNLVVSPGWVLYTKTDWPTDRRS
jgi:hypothetical protein